MVGLVTSAGIVLRGQARYVFIAMRWVIRRPTVWCWGEEQWLRLLRLLWGSSTDERVKQEPQQRGVGLCSVRQGRAWLQQATLRVSIFFFFFGFYHYLCCYNLASTWVSISWFISLMVFRLYFQELLYSICMPWIISGAVWVHLLYSGFQVFDCFSSLQSRPVQGLCLDGLWSGFNGLVL